MDFIKLLQIHFGKGISKSSLFASSLLHRTGWKYYFYTLHYITLHYVNVSHLYLQQTTTKPINKVSPSSSSDMKLVGSPCVL